MSSATDLGQVDIDMTRFSDHRHRRRHRNASLPQNLRVPSPYTTRSPFSQAPDSNPLTRPNNIPAISSSRPTTMNLFASAHPFDLNPSVLDISGNPFSGLDDTSAFPVVATASFEAGTATDTAEDQSFLTANMPSSTSTSDSESVTTSTIAVANTPSSTGPNSGKPLMLLYVDILTSTAGGDVVLAPPVSSTLPMTATIAMSNSESSIGSGESFTRSNEPFLSNIGHSTSSEESPTIMTSITSMKSMDASSTQSSAQPSTSGDGTLDCNSTSGCVSIEEQHKDHLSSIIGIVVGVVMAVVLICVAYILWRWRRRRTTRQADALEKRSVWHKKLKSDGAISTATNTEFKDQEATNMYEDNDLGEPGPAFNFYGIEAEDTTKSDIGNPMHHRKRLSESSWYDRPMSAFRSTTSSDQGRRSIGSKIGIALTRYSTAESTAPLSQPIPSAKQHKAQNSQETNLNSHQRNSSASIQSDATTRKDDDVYYVGKALTARRHSLTPRVINIVAASNSTDKLGLGSNKGGSISSTLKDDSFRSRSMSPNKLLSGYASFIDELAGRVHTPPQQMASQDNRIKRSSTTKAEVAGPAKYPIIPDRGRSVKRHADQHISYPPTSYPKLGKTMSEVKRTIREKGDSAFASSDDLRGKTREEGRPVAELPSSVTVTRGRGGK